MTRHRMPRVGQAALVTMLAITFALGCNDDGTPSVTVDADNVEDVALSATDAAIRAAEVPFLLENLGYIVLDGPVSAIASGPSAGVSEDPLCDGGGTHTEEYDETADRLTVTFTQCGIGFFECYIDGELQITFTTLGEGEAEVDANEYRSVDLTFDCGEETPPPFDGDRITCPDGADDYEECEIELASFDAPNADLDIRLSDIELYRDVSGGPADVVGTAVDSSHGRYDFESISLLEFDCDMMPSGGVVAFGGAPPMYGTIEFDDECFTYEVCLWADEEAEEPESCDLVLYPGVMPL